VSELSPIQRRVAQIRDRKSAPSLWRLWRATNSQLTRTSPGVGVLVANARRRHGACSVPLQRHLDDAVGASLRPACLGDRCLAEETGRSDPGSNRQTEEEEDSPNSELVAAVAYNQHDPGDRADGSDEH
jgi:hypothetical protein